MTSSTTIPAVLLTATLGQLTEARSISQVSLWDLVEDYYIEEQRKQYQETIQNSLPSVHSVNTDKVWCVYLQDYTTFEVAEFWDSTDRVTFIM